MYYFGYRHGFGNKGVYAIRWDANGPDVEVIKKREVTKEEYDLPLIDLEIRYPFQSF